MNRFANLSISSDPTEKIVFEIAVSIIVCQKSEFTQQEMLTICAFRKVVK